MGQCYLSQKAEGWLVASSPEDIPQKAWHPASLGHTQSILATEISPLTEFIWAGHQLLHVMHYWKCVWNWFRKTLTTDFCVVKDILFTEDYTNYEIPNYVFPVRCHCQRYISRVSYMLFCKVIEFVLLCIFLFWLQKQCQKMQFLEKLAMWEVKVVWKCACRNAHKWFVCAQGGVVPPESRGPRCQSVRIHKMKEMVNSAWLML